MWFHFFSSVGQEIDHDLQIIGCSASNNQGGYHCNEAYDGITDERGNGWAYSAFLPAWVIYELAEKGTISSLRLINGQQRNEFNLSYLAIFYLPHNVYVPIFGCFLIYFFI